MVNKTLAMTISEIEKSSTEFKKTHKIKVSGTYGDEQIPNWFKEYKEQTDTKFQQIDAKFEQIDARFEQMNNQMPKWFSVWNKEKFEPLVQQANADHQLLMKVIELNNLKVK